MKTLLSDGFAILMGTVIILLLCRLAVFLAQHAAAARCPACKGLGRTVASNPKLPARLVGFCKQCGRLYEKGGGQ